MLFDLPFANDADHFHSAFVVSVNYSIWIGDAFAQGLSAVDLHTTISNLNFENPCGLLLIINLLSSQVAYFGCSLSCWPYASQTR